MDYSIKNFEDGNKGNKFYSTVNLVIYACMILVIKYKQRSMLKLELIFLAVAAQALHLGHQQTTDKYNSTNYLTDLQARQQQFLVDIRTIRLEIDGMNSTINSSTLSSN